MSPHRMIFALLWLVLLTTSAPASAAPPAHRLSLNQAVDLGLRQSWDVKIGHTGIDEAVAKRRASTFMYFPRLKVSGNVLLWDKDLPFEIPPLDTTNLQLPAGCELIGDFGHCFDALLQAWDMGKIRERFTAQITVQLVQPITPIFSIYKLNQVNRLEVTMARSKLTRTRQQIRYEVTEAYIQAYQARVLDKIMREAEALVKAHEARVRKLLQAEVVRQAELLKLQVKLAEVKQGLIRAEAAMNLAHSNLARIMGLPIETPLTLTETFPDPPPPYPMSQAQCIARALRQRQEIEMTRIGQRQARAGRAAKRWQLVPTIAAVAQFEANHGMGTIMPKTAFFVGGVLEWEFEWGKKWRDADVLTAQLNRARLLERKARQGIPLEVKKYYLDLKVARASMKVAKAAVRAAKESHRIQIKRFEVNASTTTDVLDAQMGLTRAKSMYANALYQYYIARAALDRAMGVGK